jgi:methyl-accepting chemotaxis protein
MRRLGAVVLMVLLAVGSASAQQSGFTVSSGVALGSFVAIANGHLRTVTASLETIAVTDEARSGSWGRIRSLLQRAASQSGFEVTFVYARPDGTYYTSNGGLQPVKVNDRAYFKTAMAGRTSIGTLVKSRATGRNVSVIAVPVKGANGKVTGIVGAAVHLGSLSRLIAREMNLAPNDLFWAVNAQGVIALHSQPASIFMTPGKMSPQLARVTAGMLAHGSGTETYEFLGRTRTVVYRTSSFTGWHYGFGAIH